MKDIKIKKISTNKVAEKKIEIPKVSREIVSEYVAPIANTSKNKLNIFSVSLFGLMSVSMICYIFMISSSVFYAVKKSQYEFKAESVTSTMHNANIDDEVNGKIKSDRISYVNTDSEVSISLK